MEIVTQPITEMNFKKFGKIVKPSAHDPTSAGREYKFWSDIANFHIEGETEIGICTVYKQKESQVDALERHLNTPEILIPIDAPFVLPLYRDRDQFSQISAFRVSIGEAVVINAGIWHGPCIPLDSPESSYFVIFKKGTPFTDVEKKQVETITITV